MSLRYIVVSVVVLSLHVLLFNQAVNCQQIILKVWEITGYLPFNVLLDVLHTQHASLPCRFDHFGNENVVPNCLFALHNADDGGLSFKVSVRLNPLMSFFVFCHCFLQLNLIDLNPVPFMAESSIEKECIGFIDLSAARILSQWLESSTC
jgi:hypothetical protein